MAKAHGCDVSKYQYPADYETGKLRGLSFVACRVSIGDYYSDYTFPEMVKGYREQGLLTTGYLVTAPRDYAGGRVISAKAHLERFFNSIGDYKPDLPWIVDAELDRGETVANITHLQRDVILGLYQDSGKYPIIYTRQTWWDVFTYGLELFKKCPLWAARYAAWLTSPWSDGKCKFRDWTNWLIWQYTSHCDGQYYGFASRDGDLDWFNGDEGQLYEFAGLPKPLTTEDKVDILWREAGLRDWNLQK